MADPFVGEVRSVCFNYAPDGWLLCQGQVVNVNAYQALYALIGNQYGGQASQGTFGIPDLQGRSIIGVGVGFNLSPITWGQKTGQSQVALALGQMPAHIHTASVNDLGHNHSAALPAHTHSFAVPCDNGSGGALTTASPVGSYPTTTSGIDANINVAIADASTASQGLNTFTNVSGTPLYATTANDAMGIAATGAATASGASATGTSTTGIGVALSAAGGNTPVSTQSPALGVYYMIATSGIFPPRP